MSYSSGVSISKSGGVLLDVQDGSDMEGVVGQTAHLTARKQEKRKGLGP